MTHINRGFCNIIKLSTLGLTVI